MPKFRVTGKAEYVEQCGCEFCEGHEHKATINKIVEGVTPIMP